jgi:hypothetical protein
MRRTNLVPVKICPMRVGKRDGTFDTSLHRQTFQLEERIILSIEGLGKLS